MTDDLDALERELWESDAASSLTNRAARAITALRAQLAEALRERDDAMALFHASEKAWKARADRAEAERAAQIDRAAAIARLEAIAQAAEDAGLPDRRDGLRDAIFALRTLPAVQHAALAEAREKALREAAEMVRGTAYTSSNVGRRLEPVSPAMAGMDMHHATIADAILAMIDKP